MMTKTTGRCAGLRPRLALAFGVALALACSPSEEARASRQAQSAASPSSEGPAGSREVVSAEAQAAAQAVLDSGQHPWLAWPEVTGVLPDLKALYGVEPGRPFWFTGESAHPALEPALEAIARCDTQGLVPADYDAAKLAEKWAAISTAGSKTSAEDRTLFDMAVTVSAMRLLQSLHWGRVDPRHVGFDYDVTSRRLDLATTLRSARDGGRPARRRRRRGAPVPGLSAHDQGARRLPLAGGRRAPRRPCPRGGTEEGRTWKALGRRPALVARLRAFGDLPADAPAPQAAADGTPLYEGPLVDAVKLFQRRHGLEPDGVIGAGTIEKLNVPAAARRSPVRARARARALAPRDAQGAAPVRQRAALPTLGSRPRTPDEPLRMNVVAGKSLGHETPIFIDEMEYVIFRPYWSPPPSIIRSEIVPHARRDASYLERQNMEIVASGDEDAPALTATPENLDKVAAGKLYVRQKPGEKNSLGLAKFIFPNSENIYMHGTPAQALFARARRDFSHGCIRLEDPGRSRSGC